MKDVIEYNGRFICKNDYGYVIKDDVDSSYNLHHGIFDSVSKAKSHIKESEKRSHGRMAIKLKEFEVHEAELKKYIAQLQDEIKLTRKKAVEDFCVYLLKNWRIGLHDQRVAFFETNKSIEIQKNALR